MPPKTVMGTIPTKRPDNPLEGQLVFDPVVGKFNVYMGTNYTWVYFDELGSYLECVMCKKDLYEHNGVDHPFYKDNLAYLEHKYEQSRH